MIFKSHKLAQGENWSRGWRSYNSRSTVDKTKSPPSFLPLPPSGLTTEGLPVLNRAGDGIRTHDILLGKQTLCQLSYTRVQATYNDSSEWERSQLQRGRTTLSALPRPGALSISKLPPIR